MSSHQPLNRRRNSTNPSVQEDIRAELIILALKGYLPLAVISSICLVSATSLAAVYYADNWLWIMAAGAAAICGIRVTMIASFTSHMNKLTGRRGGYWAAVFAFMTVLFCSWMGMLTIYSFRFHDEGAKVLCVMGTFTICSGISSRIGLQPRVSQACILIMQGALAWSLVFSPELLIRYAATLTVVTAFTYCASIRNQFTVIEEQIRTRRKLRKLANHDSLTGLANRHYFETRLQTVCESETPFTLWMIDLDGFKDVNDTYGHAIGDELLRQVGKRLEGAVRNTDLLARLGGDEFVILQTDSWSESNAHLLAKRIADGISAPYEAGGHCIVIGVSAGVKIAEFGERDPERALSEADRALYRVKQAGQGGVALA